MNTIDETAIIQRIRLLREQYAGPRGKSRFARALGLTPSTYSYYENSRIAPIAVLVRICDVTGADLHWLLTGKQASKKTPNCTENTVFALPQTAPPHPQNHRTPQTDTRPQPHDGINAELYRNLDALLAQNPALREPISAFLQLLIEKKGIALTQKSSLTQMRITRPGWIPVLGRTAAGIIGFWNDQLLPEPAQAVTQLDDLVRKYLGKDIVDSVDTKVSIDLPARLLLQDIQAVTANLIQVGADDQSNDGIVEFVQCEQVFKLFPDTFALRVDGDSMSPRINDGDVVILSRSVPAAQGHIAVARVAGQIGVTCKLIRITEDAVHLIPINEKYETKVIAKKDLLWALAVLCHISA